MKLKSMAAVAVAIAFVTPCLALAAPVTWYIHDTKISVDDGAGAAVVGGSLTGHFDYDSADGSYSNIDITLKDTSDATVKSFDSTFIPTFSPNGTTILNFKGDAVPTDNTVGKLSLNSSISGVTSGTISLSGMSEIYTCGSTPPSVCNSATNKRYALSGGYISTSSTPTPTAVPTLTEWAMIGLGMALAGAAALTLHRRRRLA